MLMKGLTKIQSGVAISSSRTYCSAGFGTRAHGHAGLPKRLRAVPSASLDKSHKNFKLLRMRITDTAVPVNSSLNHIR